jgi:hypothetical protein
MPSLQVEWAGVNKPLSAMDSSRRWLAIWNARVS